MSSGSSGLSMYLPLLSMTNVVSCCGVTCTVGALDCWDGGDWVACDGGGFIPDDEEAVFVMLLAASLNILALSSNLIRSSVESGPSKV